MRDWHEKERRAAALRERFRDATPWRLRSPRSPLLEICVALSIAALCAAILLWPR